MAKKILKYPTGEIVPEGAEYLSTVTQTKEPAIGGARDCWYVWHYFLVEIDD